MKIPLALKLKKESHRKIAAAQDIIVQELYSVFSDAVLHGGTAIWRCYQANRFSEDVDVYIKKDIVKINLLFSNLEKKGFVIEKKKIGENSLYSNMLFDRAHVRFEALFKKAEGSLKEYENADGNLIIVYTLTPEEFVHEKVSAYLKRLKVRDLYDIFFMLRHVTDFAGIQADLKMLVKEFKIPADEKDLKVLILEGIVPSAKKMIDYIGSKI
jgi:predicted nucleotidyltransferase component of viral defense system